MMDALEALVGHLASPPWLFTLALALFLACRGSRRPFTPAAGAAILAAALAMAGLGLADQGIRRRVLHPERLPVAVLGISSLALLWLEMRRARRGEGPASAGGASAAGPPFASADAVAATAVGLLLVVCALSYPPRLGAVADPAARPDFVKVPWFLTGLQEVSHYVPAWVAYGAVPALLLAGLLGLPWVARDAAAAARGGRALFLFGWLLLWLWPMAVGALLRGPGWQAFGPFEPGEAGGAGVEPGVLAPRALSEIIWGSMPGTFEPASWWLRELPGMLLLAAYFVLPLLALKRLGTTRALVADALESLGTWPFYAAAAWVLALLLLPLKMYGRWLLGVGDWIHLPELSFFL